MNSLLLLLILSAGYFIAYNTYGKYLADKIFKLDHHRPCPSSELRDDKDFVPTDKEMVFGHHFTSIAGLGPIVGPAIAIIWGWVPALIWTFVGSIFMGAVHDFGALVISLRGDGRTIGDLSKNIINSRVRTLFLLIIFFAVLIVIAVFALIIAILFKMYPQAVIPVWLEIPIALLVGFAVYKKGAKPLTAGLIAVAVMYITVVIGAKYPIVMPEFFGMNPLVNWIIILAVYTYIASILPVQTLLQPRDYINSHQLFIAMALIVLGIFVSHPVLSAPALNLNAAGAPPMFPFIFVIIACGAISGFHSLVSSGTSSKQCRTEKDSLFIGYGSMLLEAGLSALVVIAIAGGLGLGLKTADGTVLKGVDAFSAHYVNWSAANGLSAKLGAFVMGASNLIKGLHIPEEIAVTIIGVFIVSFAATTLDSAARIQRYVISELAKAGKADFLAKKHPATIIAIGSAMLLSFSANGGKGGMTLWPLFGATNQLLAGLSLLVITVYLARKKSNIAVSLVPMIFMLAMTAWAMFLNISSFLDQKNWLLFSLGIIISILEAWMITESLLIIRDNYFSDKLPELEGIC